MTAISQGALRVSASAGSGKTYTLSRLYLQKALQFPGAFRGITAITFTNKAAAELKDRILENLHQLATGDPKIQSLAHDLGFENPEAVKGPARNTLAEILHDFDSLQVTTIDSFFQKIFTGLAYEINLPPGLQPDLDQELIKNEVLDLGLQQMDEETRKILLENILELLEEKGKGWRTTRYLETDLLNNLFQDVVIDFQQQATARQLSGESIGEARKKLSDYITGLTKEIQKAAADVVKICQKLGFSANQMDPAVDARFIGDLKKFKDVSEGIMEPFAPGIRNGEGKFSNPPKTRSFSESEKMEISKFIKIYSNLATPQTLANLSLAKSFLRHLSAIRLLIYFREIFKQRNLDSQRYLLQEVKFILKNFIHGEEVPYLFEKLGNRIHSLLIDEFQDTDKVQWKVILPLAKSILDNGGFFAVVGDVKQSIYSWRGADSTLFKSGIEEDLKPASVKEEVLEHNFRSETRIVEFNNWVFDRLPALVFKGISIGKLAFPEEKWKSIFQKNYENHSQKPKPGTSFQTKNGFVELRVRDRKAQAKNSEETDSGAFSWVIPEIKRLLDSGIPGNEIAILVRNNSHLKEIVNLLDQAYQEESGYDFRYSSSADISQGEHLLMRFLFLALQFCENPEKFHLVEMEALAASLGLNNEFQMADSGDTAGWRNKWLDSDFQMNMRLQPLPGRLQTCILFFNLSELSQHHSGLVEFTNLVNRYVREESGKYTDFTQWWNRKAAQENVRMATGNTGIQVVSIHKSKGLEFGVVILAIDSTATGEKNHQIDFWPNANSEPWNAFPLMKAPGKKEFIESDLGQDFTNLVCANQLEKLNVWYVALTRPRFGIVIDIALDCKLDDEKSEGKWSRPAFLLPHIFLKNQLQLTEFFPGCTLETDTESYLLRFSYGNIAYIPGKQKESKSKPLDSGFSISPTQKLPWKEERNPAEEEIIGELTHQILEKTNSLHPWKMVWEKGTREQPQSAHLWAAVNENLSALFSNTMVGHWFSDAYQNYPEQELMDEMGEIRRADRILVSKTDLVVLDFKTGIPMAEHKKQLATYARILEKSIGKKPSAWLIYTQPIELVEVG